MLDKIGFFSRKTQKVSECTVTFRTRAIISQTDNKMDLKQGKKCTFTNEACSHASALMLQF